jgi:hypothetical protein
MVVDLFLVYQFIRRLATPFKQWDAYKLGIIDENGKVLIKRKDFTRAEQRRAWGIFDIMIANIKKLLAKIPGGSSRLASYAAALFLIREWNHFSKDSLLTEDLTEEQINESLLLFNDRYVNYIQLAENVNKKINTKPELDEEPANNAGGGNIAGLGVGPQGEPGFSRAAQKKWTSQNKSKKKKLRDIMGDKI